MAVSEGTTYQFGEYRLIPHENLLLRNGEKVALPPRAFSALVLLVENCGHLVLKKELIDTIWGGTFVDDAAVSRCVWTIRSALGEDSKHQRFIQTVPKRGYKFVTHVVAQPHIVEGPRPLLRSSGGKVGRRLNRIAILAVVLLAAAALFTLLYPWTSTSSGGAPVSIAVLPFKPVDRGMADPVYGLGMAEMLINRLSTVENFRVRPLASVKRYAEKEVEAVVAGREQRVDYVLASNYQLIGSRLRITAQFVNVSSGMTVESFDLLTEVPDTLSAQDAVVAEFRDRIAARFGNREAAVARNRGTANEEAYRYYLLAQNFNELRGSENGRQALEQIDRAVALDPGFARAWATKAYIHRYLGYGAAAIEHSQRSMEAVERALAIDPDLSEAHSTLCFNKFRFEYDFAGAERACKRAIEIDPQSPLARKLYSNFLYTRGRFGEAIHEIKAAIDLQPVSYDNQQTLALALYFARRYAESEVQWKELIPLNPSHKLIYAHLVRTLAMQGKDAEAIGYLEKLLTLDNVSEGDIRRLRDAYARKGWRGAALERIRIAETRESRPYDMVRLYAAIGHRDMAFTYLEKAYQERSNMIAVVEVDPELDDLRVDPRFAEFLRKIGPPESGRGNRARK